MSPAFVRRWWLTPPSAIRKYGFAAVTVVTTTSPGRISPSRLPLGLKCTRRPSRARPDRRFVLSFFRPPPAWTSNSTSVPTRARLSSSMISSCSATKRSKRSCTISFGICSSMSAAGVPGRGEYWKVKAEENRARRTISIVAWKSSSVSPGNPTMISVVIAAPGIFSRASSTIFMNFLLRYERRISLSTLSEPDCNGMCNCGQITGYCAITSITSLVNSAGCGLVKRSRSNPSICAQAASNFENALRSRFRSGSTKFTP